MRKILSLLVMGGLLAGCEKNDLPSYPMEDPSQFTETGSIDIGEEGAAEITAYDALTRRLFVVNNTDPNRIDVIDFSNPSAMLVTGSIDISSFGAVNSLAVSKGVLAAAVEASDKQANGRVYLYRTADLTEITHVTVGALPDMVTYSADGKFILSANEGEPNGAYTVDPPGSVSIISVEENYAVKTIDFSGYNKQEAALKAKGLRVFGPGATLAQDLEPEFITVSQDSKTAWVTLQENNAIARISLASKSFTGIYPLGFKDYSLSYNGIDPSDEDGIQQFRPIPVYGMYQPDAIASLEIRGVPFLFTVNEGDVREYDAFEENERIKDISLDPQAFPDAAALQQKAALGRLNITTTRGDTDGDGDFDELYSFGARSFSVWNGNTGELLYDSRNELEQQVKAAGMYEDKRSDDKGVEPEGITLGYVGNKAIAFMGLERVDAVAIYDVTNPLNPVFLKLLATGDAPEGLLFIPAMDSPTGKSLLVVSSEGDGQVKVFEPVQ